MLYIAILSASLHVNSRSIVEGSSVVVLRFEYLNVCHSYTGLHLCFVGK